MYKVEDGQIVEDAVKAALKHGYRSVDTAAFYQNEIGVGKAIKESGLPREELFVTTKVWNSDQGYESTLKAFDASLNKLAMDYIDLYLIHWQVKGKYKETWKELEELYKDGKIRAIGVSNFHIHHLEDLLSDCEIKPAVNQVEYHPHLTQVLLREYCQRQEIQLEAWFPLKKGTLLNEPVIIDIADKYNKTPAQVILRWDLQNGVVTIPKSIKEHRTIENADLFDFQLSVADMEKIDSLNINSRSGANPDNFNF